VIDLRGEEAVAELGDRAKFVEANVTDEAAVGKALDVAETPVRCGSTSTVPVSETRSRRCPRMALFRSDAFKKVVEVNLIGTFNVLRAFRRADRQDGTDR